MEPAHCRCMLWQSLGEMCPEGTPKGSNWSGGHHFVPTHKRQLHLGFFCIFPKQTASFCWLTKVYTAFSAALRNFCSTVQQNEAGDHHFVAPTKEWDKMSTAFGLLPFGLGIHGQPSLYNSSYGTLHKSVWGRGPSTVGWGRERQEGAAAILWWVIKANDQRPAAAIITLKWVRI